MVNSNNVILGRHIDRHPLAGEAGLGEYIKGVTVIAAQAQISGVIQTPEGEMTFQPGDWIVTDNPPTHAWPIREQVFRRTYDLLRPLSESPVGPEPHPPVDPPLSAPSGNAAAQAMGNVSTPSVGMVLSAPDNDATSSVEGQVTDTPGEIAPETPQVAAAPPKAPKKGTATSKTVPGL